jgi:hypothetical protein
MVSNDVQGQYLRTNCYSWLHWQGPSLSAAWARSNFASTSPNFGSLQLPNSLPQRAHFSVSRSVAFNSTEVPRYHNLETLRAAAMVAKSQFASTQQFSASEIEHAQACRPAAKTYFNQDLKHRSWAKSQWSSAWQKSAETHSPLVKNWQWRQQNIFWRWPSVYFGFGPRPEQSLSPFLPFCSLFFYFESKTLRRTQAVRQIQRLNHVAERHHLLAFVCCHRHRSFCGRLFANGYTNKDLHILWKQSPHILIIWAPEGGLRKCITRSYLNTL